MNPIHKASAVLAAALLASLFAGAVSAGDGPIIVKTPTAEEVDRSYPERAQRLEVSGRVSLACNADGQGVLRDCKVTHEWPLDVGFGTAALFLAQSFQASGPGTVDLPINFVIAADDTLRIDLSPDDTPRSQTVRILAQPSAAEIIAA